jgi:hypothetical protein
MANPPRGFLMSSNLYCLQEDILSIENGAQGDRECLYVPAGAVVAVASEPLDDRFVEVQWNTKSVLMFNVDIRERALPVAV